MAITEHDVSRIAQLACLTIAPDQLAHTHHNLNTTLSHFSLLTQAKLSQCDPMVHPLEGITDIALRLRDDIAQKTASPAERDALMSNAPASSNGLFLVPTVLE